MTSSSRQVYGARESAGISLDELLNQLREARYKQCHVVVKAPPVDARNNVTVSDRRSFTDQYRKIGFRQQLEWDKVKGKTLRLALVKSLGYDSAKDTLLVLDLEGWSRARHKET